MININLVPPELIKRKKYQWVRKVAKSMPAEVFIGAVGGSLALLLAVNVLLQMIIFIQLANVQRLQITQDLMTPERRQVNEVLGNLKTLRQKIAVIEGVTTGKRISWTKKLNAVSDLMLPALWLEHVALDEKSFSLSGKAVSTKGNEFVIVNKFYANFKNSPVLMNGLRNPELVLGERKKEKTLEVGLFSIKAALIPESNE